MFSINAYNRLPEGDEYSVFLAGSIHFQYSTDGIHFRPLNQNYGMLFPTAGITPENTIVPRCALHPRLFRRDDTYGIAAVCSDLNGNPQAEERLCFWITKDFLSFQEMDLISEKDLSHWQEAPNAVLELSDAMGQKIVDAWTPLTAKSVFVPANLTLQTPRELWETKVLLEYSDGSTDEKTVDWEVPEKELLPNGRFTPGKHQIHGLIHRENLPYPLAVGYADPVVFPWENKWYFLSTNDNLGDIGMFIRRADTVEKLFDGSAIERCILPYNPEKGWVQTFWAPEFHVIGGEAYILFALGGHKWAPQCHMMKLKKGGDLLNPDSWEEPVRVLKADGSPLTEDGISLDMTHFQAGGKNYLAWSYRYGIGTPLDTGSMIYLAETDPQKPWQLTSRPILISRPLYGWENTLGTVNNEGPYALLAHGKVYLTYSGGSANGYSYAIGCLMADETSDLTDPASWFKMPCPLMSSYSVGIDGPGHNSFFVSDEGKTMIAYHGQLRTRCSAIHRVHFNKKGFPLLNLSPQRDLPEELRPVTVIFETAQE